MKAFLSVFPMRAAGLLVLILFGTSCSSSRSASPDALAQELISALADSIRSGGEASVVIPPPIRPYQRPAPAAAQVILAQLLALPSVAASAPVPVCRSAMADSGAVGMAIVVTELDVVGNSARVSVLRTCRERSPDRSRELRFQAEPTWILRRSAGRWLVSQTRRRVTVRPRERVDAVV